MEQDDFNRQIIYKLSTHEKKLSCGGDFRSQKTTGRCSLVWFSQNGIRL